MTKETDKNDGFFPTGVYKDRDPSDLPPESLIAGERDELETNIAMLIVYDFLKETLGESIKNFTFDSYSDKYRSRDAVQKGVPQDLKGTLSGYSIFLDDFIKDKMKNRIEKKKKDLLEKKRDKSNKKKYILMTKKETLITERDVFIFALEHGLLQLDLTQDEIGRFFSISSERVRQILAKMIKELRKFLKRKLILSFSDF